MRRLGLIATSLAGWGALCSAFKMELLYLGGFIVAIAVILIIVGSAENDHHRSS